MTIRSAADIKAREIEWLWRERIPKGMITVIAGKPAQGKGLMMALIASDVSKAGGNVFLSAAEDDPVTMIKPRLQAAGAVEHRIIIPEDPFMFPEQMGEFAEIVHEHDIQLAIIDPFNAHLEGVSRKSDSVRRVLTPWKKLANRTGLAIVVIEHALKRIGEKDDPLSGIGGASSGLPAAARMGFIFGTDPHDDERKVLAGAKWNVRDEPPAMEFEVDVCDVEIGKRDVEIPALVGGAEIVFDARRLLATSKDGDGKVGRRPDKRAEAAEWLVDYFVAANAPVKAQMVVEDAKQYGIASKTLRRAADDMAIIRDPATGGKNCTWDLPPEVKDAMSLESTPAPPDELLLDDKLVDGANPMADFEAQFDADETDGESA